MSIFSALALIQDEPTRFAALNMAIDEALLERTDIATLRVYRWDHPALSFGYFGKFSDVAHEEARDCVRRWTGGGIVWHGEDLTYALIVPANDPVFAETPLSIYEKSHASIQRAIGGAAELASVAAVSDRRSQNDPTVADRRYRTDECFANPVRADVMLNGKKIAGAAQRKTRRGLLQQGSIQYVDLAADFAERFARELSSHVISRKIDNDVLARAEQIAAEKYATDAWLRRR